MSTLPPLTHHQILALVEPFTRAGHRIDMAASDRAARRLVFKPLEHGGWRQQLQLQPQDPAEGEGWQLSRSVCPVAGTGPFGAAPIDAAPPTAPSASQAPAPAAEPGERAAPPQAVLRTTGATPALLLSRLEAVPVQRQGSASELPTGAHVQPLAPDAGTPTGAAWVITRSQHLLPPPPGGTPDLPAERLLLSDALVQLPWGYRLSLRVPRTRGISAELHLWRVGGTSTAPPPDLLAVMGMAWSRLDREREGWVASLRLRGEGLGRSRDAERRLLQAAAHLAHTLARPPTDFHPRFVRQRWAATLRRAVPLTVCGGLVAASAAVPWFNLAQDSALRMLIFNAPPILLGLFFCLPEMPRFEIPPPPRPLTAAHWAAP